MEITELRKQIDSIDDSILKLLEKRMEIVKAIGKVKMCNNEPIYRPEREQEILDRLNQKHSHLLNRKAIESVFLEIFAVSRNLELPERVSYLGPLGSYTHQAAESLFGAMCEYLSCNTITSTFQNIEKGCSTYAVIPIENNQDGVVGETLDLLKKTNLKIVAELCMPIYHCFASLSQKLIDIKTIFSKDVAFGQCSGFLNERSLENIQKISVDSTARAAELAAKDAESACICSQIAAKLYKVPILFENIQNKANQTRFIVVSDFKNKACGKDKTSLFANFENSNKPGVLYKLLRDIKDLGINITFIQSRPAHLEHNFSYCFFIDIDGHIDDFNVSELFARYPNELKWLGSYLKNS